MTSQFSYYHVGTITVREVQPTADALFQTVEVCQCSRDDSFCQFLTPSTVFWLLLAEFEKGLFIKKHNSSDRGPDLFGTGTSLIYH